MLYKGFVSTERGWLFAFLGIFNFLGDRSCYKAVIPCVRRINGSGKWIRQSYAIDIPCVRQIGWPGLTNLYPELGFLPTSLYVLGSFPRTILLINCWSLWHAKVTSYKHGSSRTISNRCSILTVDCTTDLIAPVLRLFDIIISKMCNLVLSRWSVAAKIGGKQGKTSRNDVTREISFDKTGVRSRKIQQCWIFKRTPVLSDDKPDTWY